MYLSRDASGRNARKAQPHAGRAAVDTASCRLAGPGRAALSHEGSAPCTTCLLAFHAAQQLQENIKQKISH